MSINDDLKHIINSELSAWINSPQGPIPAAVEILNSKGHLAPQRLDPEGVTSSGQPLWRVNKGSTAAITSNPSGSIGIRLGHGDYMECSRSEALEILTALWSALSHDREKSPE